MRRILVTNDDGVQSEGIRALADAMTPLGEVTVVAPMQEASAIGHALTLRRPLRIEQLAARFYAVDGTPADCVNLGIAVILKARLPDMVVSGINMGWNLGDDVTYSGTVAGALEGALLGVPALAVSLQRAPDGVFDFGPAAHAAFTVAQFLVAHPLPDRAFLNVNVPRGAPAGIRRTVQSKRNHVTKIAERVDPRGKAYYWIEEGLDEWTPHEDSDYQAVQDGYVSVTPLHPDSTAHGLLPLLQDLPAGPLLQRASRVLR